jgi:hypothetical protein
MPKRSDRKRPTSNQYSFTNALLASLSTRRWATFKRCLEWGGGGGMGGADNRRREGDL